LHLHVARRELGIAHVFGAGDDFTLDEDNGLQPDACRSGELPNGPVYFTTYLRTAETNGYVPLARDVDLRTVMKERDVAAEIPGC